MSAACQQHRASARAFTLVELLATVAVLAVLTTAAVFYTASYVQRSKSLSDQSTLQTLNDALTRYKTEGGDITALTAQAPISHVIAKMQTPWSWCGLTHQVLNAGFTRPGRSIDILGNGAQFRFTRFDTYTAEAGGSSPTGNPPGVPTGLAATAVSDSQINLTWTDADSLDTGIILDAASDAAFTSIDTGFPLTLAAHTNSYSDTGIAPSTTVYYRVRATNSVGTSANSNVTYATTPAPATPPVTLNGSMAFPATFIGESSTATLTITNNTTSSVSVTSIGCDNSVFTVSPTTATVAANGGTATVTVTFSPTAAQSFSGSLTVTSDASGGTSTTACSGIGVMPTALNVVQFIHPGMSALPVTNATSVSITTDSSGNCQWVVPEYVTNVQVLLVGGGGGGRNSGGNGGDGGRVVYTTSYAVTPGTCLSLRAGNGGTGQGAGVSSIFDSLAAAGGAGGIQGGLNSSVTSGAGGLGGGAAGQAGSDGTQCSITGSSIYYGGGGGGGADSQGGAGGQGGGANGGVNASNGPQNGTDGLGGGGGGGYWYNGTGGCGIVIVRY